MTRPDRSTEVMQLAPHKRRNVLKGLSACVLASAASGAIAQRSQVRIGWLKIQDARHTPGQLQAFHQGMKALDLIEGRDFILEERYADGREAALPNLTDELLASGVKIIVATSQPSIAAAARVTKAVPVIGRMVDDPVTSGIARSLARPGGNVTGVYTMTEELNPKRLALLKEVTPSVRRVGVLLRRDFPSVENAAQALRVGTAAARDLGIELVAFHASTADEITAAFRHAPEAKLDGMMTFRNPTVVTHLKLIAEQCLEHHLPAVFDAREYVEAGGLISYGPDIDATYRQLASYVKKLLQGVSPGELPIEQPTTFQLVINERTANAIGVVMPPSILARADEVIGG